MMGKQKGDQRQLFYLFNLEDRIPQAIYCVGSIQSLRGCWPICATNYQDSTATSAGRRLIPN